MTHEAFAVEERTRRFFRRVIRFCEALPENRTTAGIGEQLTDSAGGTENNYRGACRARSREEFIRKIGMAAEEANESKGWLSALLSREYGDSDEARVLIREACALTAIFTASQKTASNRAGDDGEGDGAHADGRR